MTLPTIILGAFAAYLLIGAGFATAFVMRGIGQIDPVAREARWSVRLLLWPGSMALWPWLMRKWLLATRRSGASAAIGGAR